MQGCVATLGGMPTPFLFRSGYTVEAGTFNRIHIKFAVATEPVSCENGSPPYLDPPGPKILKF